MEVDRGDAGGDADARGSGFAPAPAAGSHPAARRLAAWSATDDRRLQSAVLASRLGGGGPVTGRGYYPTRDRTSEYYPTRDRTSFSAQ